MTGTSATRPEYRLPRSLTLAVVFTLVALGWLTRTAFLGYRLTNQQLPEIVRIEELRGQILLWDEVLTMSVRMAAATSDPQWEARYLRVEPQLHEALLEAVRRTPAWAGSQAAARTAAANTKLVALEKRAFALERQRQPAAARELLDGAAYEASKKAYADGMAEMSRQLRQAALRAQAAQEAELRWSVILAAVSAPLLIFSWCYALRAVWRAQTAVLARNQDLNRQAVELREKKARFDQLAEQSGLVLWEVDTQGLFTYVSHVAEAVLGYPPEDLVGRRHFFDLHVASKGEPQNATVLAKFRQNQPFHHLERAIRAKDGRLVWLSSYGIPLFHPDGALRGFRGSDADITERKRVGEITRLMHFTVDQASEVIAWIRPDATYAYVNETTGRLLGYSREEMMSKSVPDINPGMTLQKWQAQWRQLQHEKNLRYEAVFITKEGRRVPVEATVSYLLFEGQEYSCGFARDITERKQAEADLRQRHEELTRFNEVMVGRELRMIELKEEVNALCQQQGQPARYQTHEGSEMYSQVCPKDFA